MWARDPPTPTGPLLYLSDMKTYDAFARMKNMDTVKQLAAPKSSRLLVEEQSIVPPDGNPHVRP